MTMDQGAYPAFPFSAAMFPMMIRTMMPGPVPPARARLRPPRSPRRTRPPTSRTAVRGRSRRGCASACSTSPRASSGIGRDEIRLRNMIGARRAAARRCSPVRRSTSACRHAPRSSARSRSPTSSDWPSAQAAARAEGRVPRPRVRHLHRGRAGPARLPGVGHARRRRRAAGRRAGARRCSRPTARCRCSPSRCRTARATRPRWPRSRPTSSACRSSRCACATATRRSRRSA